MEETGVLNIFLSTEEDRKESFNRKFAEMMSKCEELENDNKQMKFVHKNVKI